MANDLYVAIETHDLKTIEKLLAERTDPNGGEQAPGFSPLHAAIYELDFGGPLDAVAQLLSAGANVNRREAAGNMQTPLVAAIADQQLDVVPLLLSAGADPNLRSGAGDSPLSLAVERNDLQLAETLLNAGAARTIDEAGGIAGMSPLGLAVSRLNLPMVRLLLKFGASPSALDVDYQIARRHLPQRTHSNAVVWDSVLAALEQQKP